MAKPSGHTLVVIYTGLVASRPFSIALEGTTRTHGALNAIASAVTGRDAGGRTCCTGCARTDLPTGIQATLAGAIALAVAITTGDAVILTNIGGIV